MRMRRVLFCLWGFAVGMAPLSIQALEAETEAKARLESIEQALADSDLEAARRELSAVKALVGEQLPTVQYFEGRLAFEDGRYPEAIRLLERAGIEDKPASYLRLAKDTQSVMVHHRSAASAHFVFLYPPGKDEVLAPYALDTLEAIRTALLNDLGYAPPGKVRVEVVGDAEELAKVSTLTLKEINTTGTIAICKFSKLMVTSPKAVANGYDWQDTLAHEYTHLVVTQKGHNSVPIWLQEGLAKYLETAWRGPPGESMSPSQRALLGRRVKENKLIPFSKMHPSIAMLPSWEDAYTAFAEVFFAADYLFKRKGAEGLKTVVEAMAHGSSDQQAVEEATGQTFADFEKGWMAHLRAQPVPKGLIPPGEDKVVLKGSTEAAAKGKPAQDKADKGKEISFRDFAEVVELQPRRDAHLGELFRARNRMGAAAEEFGKAYALVGDRYEAISNKYALALLSLKRLDEAQKVLEGAVVMHPGSAQTQVHLGRLYLERKDFTRAKGAYLAALAVDPFDPEVHLALLRVGMALSDTPLTERARKAVALLTGH